MITDKLTTRQRVIFYVPLLILIVVASIWAYSKLFPKPDSIKDNEARQEQTKEAIKTNTDVISDNNAANESQAQEAVKIGKRAAKRVNAPVVVRKAEADSMWMEIENEENTKEL